MRLGYNTNGFAHHRLDDALALLAELGYQSVALTLDVHSLNPFEPNLARRTAEVRRRLETLGLRCVVETGARFLLDPRRKHQPTLISAAAEGRAARLNFLKTCVDLAADLQADAVSFWSGAADSADGAPMVHMDWLAAGCLELCEHAQARQVRLAFEPEPGMLIDTMPRFAELMRRVAHPSFGLTLDVGHLHCMRERPAADHIACWRQVLWNVHLEDMKPGVHEHLMFGEGDMHFPPILQALRDLDVGVHVELSRHGHDAVRTAERALQFLKSQMASQSHKPEATDF